MTPIHLTPKDVIDLEEADAKRQRNAGIVAGALRRLPEPDPKPMTPFQAIEALESVARSAESWRKRYAYERELTNDLNEALLKLERKARIKHAAWCAIGLVVGLAAALWWGW